MSFMHAKDAKGENEEWAFLSLLLHILRPVFYGTKRHTHPARVIIRPNRAKRRRNKAKVTRAAGNFSRQISCWDTQRLANSLSPSNFTFKLRGGGLWKMLVNLHPVSRPAILLAADRKLALGLGDLLCAIRYISREKWGHVLQAEARPLRAVNLPPRRSKPTATLGQTRTKNCSKSLREKSNNAPRARGVQKRHLYGPVLQPNGQMF